MGALTGVLLIGVRVRKISTFRRDVRGGCKPHMWDQWKEAGSTMSWRKDIGNGEMSQLSTCRYIGIALPV